MNSTVQCLFRVPELRARLAAYAPGAGADPAHKLTLATRQLFAVRHHPLTLNARPVSTKIKIRIYRLGYGMNFKDRP